MIYFIADTLTGHVKIGSSENPWRRADKIQSDCPGQIVVLAILDGGEPEEGALHDRFRHHKVRGEWFRNEGDLADYIGGLPVAERPLRRSSQSDAVGQIAALRRRLGLTQAEFAAQVGIKSQGHLSEMEKGATPITRPFALTVFARFGVKLAPIADFSEAEIATLLRFQSRAA